MADKSTKFSVAFSSEGSMGSLIIHANFIKMFKKRFENYDFTLKIFGHPFEDVNNAVFFGQNWVDEIYTFGAKERKEPSDVFINLNFYPQVWTCNKKVEDLAPDMYKLIMNWKKEIRDNEQKNYFFTNPNQNINAIWEGIIKGKTCLNTCDITGELGIGKDYDLKINIKKNPISLLHKLNLENKKFITLHRGNNFYANVKETPRLWPHGNYENLIQLLKKEFPNVILIQLGSSKAQCDSMKGVDLDLVGKTDFEDLKALLKSAWMHIDGEGDMIHLRRALGGGPSVVMYGQTPKEFYAYESNINLSTDACPVSCARLTDDWEWRCARGDEKPACMHSITPDIVIDAIKNYARDGNTKLPGNSLYEQILADNRFILDKEWIKQWLNKRHILYYDIYDIRLKDIVVSVYQQPYGWSEMPLEQSPLYMQFIRKDQTYPHYAQVLSNNNIEPRHTLQTLAKSMMHFQLNYDSRYMPVVDGRSGILLDGQMRLSWLMHKYGPDYITKVIKLWSVPREEFL